MTRASVLSEKCRVLLYQVISLSEKLLKGFSTPVFAPWVWRVGCATGSPIFQGVGCPEKKPVYNSGCYGRGCGRLVLLFPPRATRPVVVWWELEETGVGVERSGHQGACWHSQTVLKPSHHCAQPRGCSNTAMSFVPHHESKLPAHELQHAKIRSIRQCTSWLWLTKDIFIGQCWPFLHISFIALHAWCLWDFSLFLLRLVHLNLTVKQFSRGSRMSTLTFYISHSTNIWPLEWMLFRKSIQYISIKL